MKQIKGNLLGFLAHLWDETISAHGVSLILGLSVLFSNLPAQAKENMVSMLIGANGTLAGSRMVNKAQQEELELKVQSPLYGETIQTAPNIPEAPQYPAVDEVL